MEFKLQVVDDHSAGQGKYIETLELPGSCQQVGYRFGGAFPGPKLLIAGDGPLIEQAFARLSNLPTFPWMRGQLWLIQLGPLEDGCLSRLSQSFWDTPFDEMILLPFAAEQKASKQAVDEAYWSVLRLCADLGMISGRGVRMVGLDQPLPRYTGPYQPANDAGPRLASVNSER